MIPKLDRSSPTPLHQQIQVWMHDQIVNGHWPEHYRLPAEIDLADSLGVNRGTLRNAMKTLIDEGLLVRIHGKGTFVASSTTVEQPLAESLVTFSEGLTVRKIPFKTRVLEQSLIRPGHMVASLLSLQEEEVFFLKRIRSVKDEPLIYLKNYVVCQHCPEIAAIDFSQETLFHVLENRFNLELDWGRRFFEAQAASSEVAAALDITPGDPVMYIEQIVYLSDGSPIELSNLWVKGGHFRIAAVVKRDNRRSDLDLLTIHSEHYYE